MKIYSRILPILFCCIVYCLGQPGKPGSCNGMGHPNVTLTPSQCCNIPKTIDPSIETSCTKNITGLSNVGTGICGSFDGMECFFDCMLNGTNAVKGNTIDYELLKNHMTKNVGSNSNWTNVINNAVNFCKGKLEANIAAVNASMGNIRPDGVRNCSPKAAYLLSCVFFQQIVNCQTPVSNNQDCTKMKDFYKTNSCLPLHSRPNSAAFGANPQPPNRG